MRLRLLSRLLLKSFTPEAQREAPLKLAAVVLLAGVSLFSVSVLLGFLFTRALLGQPAGPFFLPPMSWGTSSALVGIFFYAALTLSSALTNRNELMLLLLSPLPPRIVVADRLLAISGSFSALLAIVGLPLLSGAGGALQAPLGFFLTAVAVVLILPLAPSAAALLLTVAVLRWTPPRRARVVTAGASAIAAGAVYLFGEAVGSLRGRWSGGWDLSPLNWFGQALVRSATGDGSGASLYLAAALVLTILLSLIATDAAARLLTSGWATYTEVPHRRRGHAGTNGATLPFAAGELGESPPILPLMRKEWLTVRRDPKLIAQLAYPLVLEGFMLVKSIGNPFTAQALNGRLERLFAGSLYLSASLTALFLLTILALPMVGREGRSIYLLAIAPIRARDILVAKILVCALPVLALVELLLVTIGARLLRLSPSETVFLAFVFAALVLALSAWLVCAGILWPRLTSDNSRRQIHGVALLVGPTAGVALAAFVGWLLNVVFTVPPHHAATTRTAAILIFLLTGTVVLAVLVAGPRALHALLTGDRRPA